MSEAPAQPDYAQAVDFLRRFHAGRSFTVVAIGHAAKKIAAETFTPDESSRCEEWLRAAGTDSNVYHHVNEPIRHLTKKGERTDIRAVWWLHCDIDPRAGNPIDAERARILAALRDPPGLPPPTLIVFSGGGFQGFWRLREPIVIDGDLGRAEEAALYNLAIERALGADATHDISRIMRVPYTLNVPNAKKRAKGQLPTLAEVVEWH